MNERHCLECAEVIDAERAGNRRVMNCTDCAERWAQKERAPKRKVRPFSYTNLPRRDFVPRRMALERVS
jgi:hypothetical protein